jgi:hypothetical protein
MDLNDLIKNPEQIKGLIQILQALLPADSVNIAHDIDTNRPDSDDTTTSEPYHNPVIKTKGGGSKRTKQSPNNSFEKMSEFHMHKEDSAIDKILCKAPPVARVRTEASPVSVVCRICGKQELVNPSLVFESISRYKCNNCSTQAG